MGEQQSGFEGHAILELMGHRRIAGTISQETIAGAPFIRIDIPGHDLSATTQFYSAAAVYAITPTTWEIVRAIAHSAQPAPVQRWELPQLAPPKVDPIAWLADGGHDRLYHAFSVVRHGVAGQSNDQDEHDARELLVALRDLAALETSNQVNEDEL